MIEFLPAETDQERAERNLRYRRHQMLLYMLGDVYERETEANRINGDPVHYDDEELEVLRQEIHRLQMTDPETQED